MPVQGGILPIGKNVFSHPLLWAKCVVTLRGAFFVYSLNVSTLFYYERGTIMDRNQNTIQQCPKCGNTTFTNICPYCHIDITKKPMNKISTAEIDVATKKIEKIASIIVWGLLIIGSLFLISQCTKDDGTCERCKKEGIYEIGGDKYCEKHYIDVLGEVIAWDGN